MPEENNKKPSADGGYYNHKDPFETINYMEYLSRKWTENGVPPEVQTNLLNVIKYCSPRLGKKGGIETLKDDLFKIANYSFRSWTHVSCEEPFWITEVLPKKDSE